MESSGNRLPSLAGCYVLLVILAGASLMLRLPSHAYTEENFLPSLAISAIELRTSAHATWMFFAIFLGVWVCCLLWAVFDVRRRDLYFEGRDAKLAIGMTVLVLGAAVLYGLGTNGVLAHDFPQAIDISDALGCLFLLSLPGIVWLRISAKVREAAARDAEDDLLVREGHDILSLDGASSGKLLGSMKQCTIIPVNLLASTQAMYAGIPTEQTRATMDPLIERAEMPAMSRTATEGETGLTTTNEGTARFRENLSVLNSSWDSIESAGKDLERWFDLQRQAAVAHLAMPPAARAGQNNSPEGFPHETLAAVDAEWAKIRQAALEIARWFGDLPPERNS